MQVATHKPEVTTKNLAMNVVGDRRKVRISSNFLDLYGLKPDTRIRAIPNKKPFTGFQVVPDMFGPLSVYKRSYRTGRQANPHEAVVEFASKELLGKTIPEYAQRFHVEMRDGLLNISPLQNRTHFIHTRLKSAARVQSALVAMTGGVDAYLLEEHGFSVEAAIEYRPQESRDKGRRLTEANALNVLRNCTPRMLINEDVYQMDHGIFSRLIEELPPIGVFVVSLQCDDFSNAKDKAAKKRAIEDLSTTIDMFIPVLNHIDVVQPASILVENVKGFMDSDAGAIFVTALRRKGYFVTQKVLNSLDYGARQQRERCYIHASIYPNFTMPAPTGRRTDTISDLIDKHLHECDDKTHTGIKANQAKKAAEKNRKAPTALNRESTHCGTIMKSQNRGVTDAQYLELDGKLYAPSEGMVKDLMSIPQDFDVSRQTKELAFEILGQSLDGCTHNAMVKAMNDHLSINLGKHRIVQHRIKPARKQ